MTKHFVSAQELLEDSFHLAKLVEQSGFVPDLIVGIWRGGAPIALAVHEYLSFKGITSDHCCIGARSYSGIDQRSAVSLQDEERLLARLPTARNILLVDDIFDTGRTMHALLNSLAKHRQDGLHTVKFACPWYKPARNLTALEPDYFLHTTDQWVVFPHELLGLSEDDIANGKSATLAALLSG